jgi:hypothetical protein
MLPQGVLWVYSARCRWRYRSTRLLCPLCRSDGLGEEGEWGKGLILRGRSRGKTSSRAAQERARRMNAFPTLINDTATCSRNQSFMEAKTASARSPPNHATAPPSLRCLTFPHGLPAIAPLYRRRR